MSAGTLSGHSRLSGLLGLLWILWIASVALADPLTVKYTSCLADYPSQVSQDALLNVSEVYANVVPPDAAKYLGLIGDGRTVVRVDMIGNVGSEVQGYSNETNKLATLFHDTNAAHVSVWESSSWLCESLFPADLPRPYGESNETYCPLPSGPFAINVSIPLYRSYPLTTLRTRVRVVDTTPEANTIACYDLEYTPWVHGRWYYSLIKYFPVALAIGFWAATWGARFAAGWVVGSGVAEYEVKEGHGLKAAKRDARMRKWGTMIVSGLSGERLSVSGGLLRFATPGLRDIVQYIQFTTILGMVAVNWPDFAYPIITRGAWADMVGNVTVISGLDSKHVSTDPGEYKPSSQFARMMSDPKYPLYLDPTAFNPLLDLHGAKSGMESFATTVGLRKQDLYSTSMVVFMIMTAGIVLLSLVLWTAHGVVEYVSPDRRSQTATAAGYNRRHSSLMSSPRASLYEKDLYDPRSLGLESDFRQQQQQQNHHAQQPPKRLSAPSRLHKVWLRFRPKGEAGAFHAAAMYGNLLRLILMFHLPITAFSIYQLTLSQASIVSRVFAALSFAFISVGIPAFIMFKIYRTPRGKLYDATRTLLSLGTMYNVFTEGKQMFRVFPLAASLIEGIAIGAGQKSGLAQAVILLVVELVMLILAAFWYPWGEGASMGAPNAVFGIIRVVSVVLTMLLSPKFEMSTAVTDWFAYTILLLQAIVFVIFLFMLLSKIIEGLIRLFGGVHFDESTSPLDGGLLAAIMDLDCLNGRRGGKAAERRRRKRGSQQLQKNVFAAGSLTTQQMLDRNSQGIPRQDSGGALSYLTSNPSFGDSGQATMNMNYFPTTQPPLGPPPDRARRSFEDDGANEPIMNAWRPPSASPPTSPPINPMGGAGSSPQSFSVVRGSRADAQNPYAVKGGSSFGSYSPAAGPSSRPMSTAPSPSQSPMPLLQHQHSNGNGSVRGLRPNNQGLMPPQLSIPKRRSLNDLKEDQSPSSEYPDPSPNKKKSKGRRFSAGPKRWFARDDSEPDSPSGDSDDEAGHAYQGGSRRIPRPFEAVPSPLGEKKRAAGGAGWLAALGLIRRHETEEEEDAAERVRDENKVRKDALANESGSLFAGVDAPRSGFVVHRKQISPTVPKYNKWRESKESGGIGIGIAPGMGAGMGTQRYSLSRSREASSSSSTPLATLKQLEGKESSTSTPPERSFKVKRMSQGQPRLDPAPAPAASPSSSATYSNDAVAGPSGSSPAPGREAPTSSPDKTAKMDKATRESTGQGGHGVVKSKPIGFGLKRQSNVVKSPTLSNEDRHASASSAKSPTSSDGSHGKDRRSSGGVKSPTGPSKRNTGGLWGDLEQFGVTAVDKRQSNSHHGQGQGHQQARPASASSSHSSKSGTRPASSRKNSGNPTSHPTSPLSPLSTSSVVTSPGDERPVSSFKVRRAHEYQPPPISSIQSPTSPGSGEATLRAQSPPSSFVVRRPQEWSGSGANAVETTPSMIDSAAAYQAASTSAGPPILGNGILPTSNVPASAAAPPPSAFPKSSMLGSGADGGDDVRVAGEGSGGIALPRWSFESGDDRRERRASHGESPERPPKNPRRSSESPRL